jgi:hypothetical protein
MKILLDFPDMPQREIVPYPMEFEAGAGYLVVVVHRIDNKLVMTYNVARAPLEGKSEAELAVEDRMMGNLESLASLMARSFNE